MRHVVVGVLLLTCFALVGKSHYDSKFSGSERRKGEEVERLASAGELEPEAEALLHLVEPESVTPEQLRGSIVVYDAQGDPWFEESGHFRVSWADGASFRVSVDRGRFDLGGRTTSRDRLRSATVDDLHLRQQFATFGQPELSTLLTDGLQVQADWVYGGLLHVTDAATGEALAGVRCVRATSVLEASRPTPLGIAQRLTGPPSQNPMLLPETGRSQTLWVGAPGYAWQRLSLTDRVDDVTVGLHRGSEVEIHVDRSSAAQRGALAVRAYQDDEWVASAPVVDAAASMFGLLPGVYEFRLEEGVLSGSRAILDRSVVDLRPAGVSVISFDERDEPWTELASLTLELTFAESVAIDVSRWSLSCEPAGGAAPFRLSGQRFERVGDSVYRVEFPTIAVGEWAFVLEPSGDRVELSVPGDRHRVEALMVAPLSRVVGRIETAEGEVGPAHSPVIYWRRTTKEADGAWQVAAAAADGEHEWLAPRGSLDLMVMATGFRSLNTTVQADSAEEVVAFTLEPQPLWKLSVELRRGEAQAAISLSEWGRASLRCRGGDGQLVSKDFSRSRIGTGLTASRAEFWVDRPGDYVISLPGIELADARVEVSARVHTTARSSVTIQLQ